jgi:hypothetical protein
MIVVWLKQGFWAEYKNKNLHFSSEQNMKLVILHCTDDVIIHQKVIVTFLKRKLNYCFVNCLGEKVYVACGFLIFLFC